MSRRHSPAVYRRRRFVVFGGLLLVLAGIGVGIWLLIAQPWQSAAADEVKEPAVAVIPSSTEAPEPASTDEPADTAEEEPDEEPGEGASDAASDDPASDAEPEPGTDAGGDAEAEPVAETEVAPCSARDIRVEAVTDATSYRSGALPKLSIRLTNNGEAGCTMNVGTTTQKFTITSGADVWWRSTDCQSEPSDLIVTLAAGQTVTTAEPIEWNRTRSSVGTCDQESRPKAPGNGASYHLAVEIGGVRATKTQQIFLY